MLVATKIIFAAAHANGGGCHKYHFCREKRFVATNTCTRLSRQNTSFVAAKVCLSRQNATNINVCLDKHTFVGTKDVFVAANVCRDKWFVAANIIISGQNFCHDKNNTCGSCRHDSFRHSSLRFTA